jgi:hypothetical protein
MPAFFFPPTCPPFPGPPTHMSTISLSTMMSNSTQSHSNTTSALMLSAGMVLSVPNPIRESPRDGVIGPIAALEQRAATLSQRAIQAAAVARDAAADAADINNAHATIVAQHRKIFLVHAFSINPNGTAITDPSLLPEKLKTYKSVKFVEQYNFISKVLSNWGDDAILKEASPDDPNANACRNYHKENIQDTVTSSYLCWRRLKVLTDHSKKL